MEGRRVDKKLSVRLKVKVHRTAVRPTLISGAETWPMKKTQEKRMNVAEMRMLRWM